MERTFDFETKKNKYQMTPASAMKAWAVLKNALTLLRNMNIAPSQLKDYNALGAEAIMTLLSNLNDPVVKELENLVFTHTRVVNFGEQPFKLSEQADEHFELNREDFIPVVVEGVKYQFEGFLTGGFGYLMNMKR